MAFHFGAAFTARAHMPHFVTIFLEHGDIGVPLFFMLSGFILYYTYEDNLKTGRDLYKFFVARVARLYPVYLLAIAIAIPLNGRLPHGRELLIFPMLQSWTVPASSFGYTWIIQAWTLSVEAFFYLCFPMLLLLLQRGWSAATLWCASAALFAVNVALRTSRFHPSIPSTWVSTHILLPVLCLPQFFLGMTLGALFLRKQSRIPDSSSNDWITLVGMLLSGFVISSGVGGYFLEVAAFVGCAWSIYRLADGRGWLTNALSNPIMMLLGGASFSVYILQGLIREYSRRAFAHTHPGLDAALSPIILIGISCLIFLYYEEPMRDKVRGLLIPASPKVKSRLVSN